ncbi:ABC transporter permease [Azospirillum halopraeferens]|uniref:ABC transporter permease n=1 Tax=Azospirillum halopraeferens TaxID=34010 RepID=UPI000417E545|nr:FtsX-like permease family protein [Azospirillum halopraeferens]
MMWVGTAIRLAWRDLRGGAASLWILVLGVALGTAVMAAVGSLGGGVLAGMHAAARESAGGDLSLRLFHAPVTPDQRAALDAAGTVSETAELRPVATRPDGGARTLVELKAVDAAYPLAGTAVVAGAPSLHDALARRDGVWGAAVDPALLDALALAPGDRLRLGGLEVAVRAVIVQEPDRAFRAFTLGPRVIIARDALDATGLAGPGAAVYWYYRVALPAGAEAGAAVVRDLERRFPDAGWRIVDASRGIPGVERTVQLVRALVLLAALAVLLIGGVGVAGAVTAHLARRLPAIATLKALGGAPRQLFAAFLGQTLAAAGAAVLAGAAGGALLAAAAARALPADWMPGAAAAVRPDALVLAALAGLLATLLCALPPLARAVAARPAAVWRNPAEPPPARPGRRVPAAVAVLGLALALLVAAWTGMPVATAGFLLVAAAVAGAFALLGRAVAAAARRLARRGGPLLRPAVANLGRPGAPTVPVAMALGIGLTLLVAVGVTAGAARRHVDATLPATMPAVAFLNLPQAAAEPVRAGLAGLPGVTRVETAPFLHARISRLNGVPVGEADVPRSVAWAVRGDRGVSWRDRPPSDTALTAGAWWPAGYAGPPLASVDVGVARRLGLAVGDTLTLALARGPVTATVANLRSLDWSRLDLDFPVLLSPPPVPPPHTLIAAVWSDPAAVPAVEAAMAALAPDAPAVRAAEVLETLGGAVERLRATLDGVAAAALGAAAVVLLGTVAAGLRRRRHEAAVLHVLGIGRRRLAATLVLEFTLLGAAVALVAAPLGWLGGAAVAVAVSGPGSPLPGPGVPAAAAAATVAAMAAVGAGVAAALGRGSVRHALRGGFD